MSRHPSFSDRDRRFQAGLSLVELMVSIAIGLFLLAIVIQIFLGSKNNYRVTDSHSRLQENGRYIIGEISRDVRMAGYVGCAKSVTPNNIAEPTSDVWLRFNEAVHGYESVPSSPNIGLTSAEVLSGTDIVRVQRAHDTGAQLSGNLATDNANIQIDDNAAGIAVDDILVISDCVKADVFRANSVSSGGGGVTITHSAGSNTVPKLSKAYEKKAQLMRLGTHIYYIGTGSGGCSANMLCRKKLSGITLTPEELIDNVENMQIEYGEDTDLMEDWTADRFVTAGSVADWKKVVSIRLSLLLRSKDANLATKPQTYTFNGTTVTATDHKLRRVFSTTITLRNRTL